MTEMHLHFMIVKHVFLIKIHETKIIIELDLNSGLSTSMHYNKLETSLGSSLIIFFFSHFLVKK